MLCDEDCTFSQQNARCKAYEEKLKNKVIVTDKPTTDYNKARMMGLLVTGYEHGPRTNEARISGSWERRDYELRKLGLRREHEDKYEDQ